MAKVFLDTNFFFDVIGRDLKKQEILDNQTVFVSALSYHILFYTYKYTVPNRLIETQKKEFGIVDFTDTILSLALEGPTRDLEDNVQLHSAAKAGCEVFLTNDKNILKMKFFGLMKILSTI